MKRKGVRGVDCPSTLMKLGGFLKLPPGTACPSILQLRVITCLSGLGGKGAVAMTALSCVGMERREFQEKGQGELSGQFLTKATAT